MRTNRKTRVSCFVAAGVLGSLGFLFTAPAASADDNPVFAQCDADLATAKAGLPAVSEALGRQDFDAVLAAVGNVSGAMNSQACASVFRFSDEAPGIDTALNAASGNVSAIEDEAFYGDWADAASTVGIFASNLDTAQSILAGATAR